MKPRVNKRTAAVLARIDELAELPLDAPDRPGKLARLLLDLDGARGGDGEDLALSWLDMEHGRAIQEWLQRIMPQPYREPLPELTVCPGLYQYPHPPICCMFYDQGLGRLMLLNPYSRMAVALDVTPDVEESYKNISAAGVAGLRKRYGQDHVHKLLEGLAMMPDQWAALDKEREDAEAAEQAPEEAAARGQVPAEAALP